MKKILVTAIGSSAADIVIRTLHREGWEIIGTDIYPKEWLVNSWHVERFVQVPKALESEKYISNLLSICEEESVHFLIPLTDIEIDILSECRSLFADRGICICISDKESIRLCRNKRMASAAIEGKTLCRVVPEYGDWTRLEQINVPTVCKPINGRSSQGIRYFENKRELQCFLENKNREDYLVQPFIEGKIIVADVLRDKQHDVCIVVTRKELLRSSNGLGTAVQIFFDETLEEICIQLADIFDIHGCVNFEFIETEEGWYFLECNPRFSGGIAYSVMSGYDFVNNLMKCFQKGMKPDTEVSIKKQYIVRQYAEYIEGNGDVCRILIHSHTEKHM